MNHSKKNKPSNNQLSLFDLFLNNQTENTYDNKIKSDISGNIHDQSISTGRTDLTDGRDNSNTIQSSLDASTTAFGQHEIGGGAGELSQPSHTDVPSTDESANGKSLNNAENAESWAGSIRSSPGSISGRSNRLKNFSFSYNPEQNTTQKTFSKPQAFRRNIEALKALARVSAGEPLTPELQQTIASYSGFGGLKEILIDPNDPNPDTWQGIPAITKARVSEIHDIIKTLAKGDDTYIDKYVDGVKRTILSAHFTPDAISSAIYEIILKTGFKGGYILDPASGTGRFISIAPKQIAENSQFTAVEIDPITGLLLQKILPAANVQIQPFERAILPKNHYDLILTNVPFARIPIYDPIIARYQDKRFEKAASNLHNFFIAKSILLAKPGALLAFVTSRFTLDSTENKEIRQILGDYCQMVTALRLPETAFLTEAGTEVVSDILIFQKRDNPIMFNQDNPIANVFDHEFTDHNNTKGTTTINEFFLKHPNHVLGKHAFTSGMFRENNYTVIADDIDLDVLHHKIVSIGSSSIQQPLYNNGIANLNFIKQEEDLRRTLSVSEFDTIGNLVQFNDGYVGRISMDEHSELTETGEIRKLRYVDPVTIRKEDARKVGLLIKIRQHLKQVIYYESNGYPDAHIEPIRQNLKLSYNQFTKLFGHLQAPANAKLLKLDAADSYLISSIEKVDPDTKKIIPADILYQRTINVGNQNLTNVDNLEDAITLSTNQFGGLKMDFISELLGQSIDEVMSSQDPDQPLIFFTPEGFYETRDKYLSGNVVEKLTTASSFAQEDPRFKIHVKALKAVQPKPIPAQDIYSPIHARWIPKQYIEDFIAHISKAEAGRIGIAYYNSSDEYEIKFLPNTEYLSIYQTKHRAAQWVLEHVLNGVEPIVKIYTKESVYIDQEDTLLAKENYKKIQALWDDFKYQDYNRRTDLEKIYNARFNNTVLRDFTGAGAKMVFPGLIGFVPKPHQKDCVFRMLQNRGGLGDHIVGAGKTLVQVITSYELRRLKLANKPMIIGIKAQVPDLYAAYKQAYPFAKVLFPSEKDFEAKNRKKLLSSIATNDWDCIILTHDQFAKIPQNPKSVEATYKEFLNTLDAEIAMSDDAQDKKRLEARKYKYTQKLAKLGDIAKDTEVLDFSQLGVDFLMVDESHQFKNLEFTSRLRNVQGLGNQEGSKRAFNLMLATRYLQEIHGGDHGVAFFSGTPLSNSISELYLIQKYLTPSVLKQRGINSFDQWASIFASIYSDLEYYLGQYKVVNRIREFKNLPELITMYREFADVRNDTNLVLEKPKGNHTLVKIQPSGQQLKYIDMLFHFVQSKGHDYRNELGLTAGYDSKTGKNNSAQLLAINMAKKLSLDTRLISPLLEGGTKIGEVTKNVYRIFQETTHFKGTQLIFCDLSTPKSKNTLDNLYDLFEGDQPQDIGIRSLTEHERNSIFGTDYYDAPSKPSLAVVKKKLIETLTITEAQFNLCVQLANENNGGFVAYESIKTGLIKLGIPGEQIAFIHDYNTRTQRAQLFEKINHGEIRITLGSTPKLGVGTNVQYRLAALHHVDINWKPSDLDQRNGRGERQGNWAALTHLNNNIDIFYYATERTFDSYMYNLNGIKTRFIQQVKTDKVTVREVKDINEEIDLSAMGAELSGNPLVKEKATLDRKVLELTALKNSHASQKYNAQETIRRAEKGLEYALASVIKYQKLIEHIATLPVDPDSGNPIVTFRINGKEYTKPGEAGTALLKYQEQLSKLEYEKVSKSKYYQVNDDFVEIGEVSGYQIMAKIHSSIIVDYFIQEPLTKQKIGSIKTLSSSELGAALSIRNSILGGQDLLNLVNESIESQNQTIKNANAILNKSFEHEEELRISKERLFEINKQIHEAISNKTTKVEEEEVVYKTSLQRV
jgi:N12 class adenine-specific DNA methylase